MNNQNTYLGVAVVAVITAVLIYVMVQPRHEEPDTAVGRAAEEISEGIDDAGRELSGEEPTTGEKVGEAVEDLGNDIKDASDSN